MEINLLPRKQSRFSPAWILWGLTSISIILTISKTLSTYNSLHAQESDLKLQDTNLTLQQNAFQSNRNVVDPRIEKVKQYEAELNRLDEQRINWRQRLEDISGQMPTKGSITKFSYQSNGVS